MSSEKTDRCVSCLYYRLKTTGGDKEASFLYKVWQETASAFLLILTFSWIRRLLDTPNVPHCPLRCLRLHSPSTDHPS